MIFVYAGILEKVVYAGRIPVCKPLQGGGEFQAVIFLSERGQCADKGFQIKNLQIASSPFFFLLCDISISHIAAYVNKFFAVDKLNVL